MSKKSVIKLLQYNDIEIIGSAKSDFIKYPSDIDLQETITTDKTFEDIYHFFVNIFKKAKENKKVFITDFKCGFHAGVPVRWNYETLMQGFQMIGEDKITFEQCLSQMSTIKIDLVSLERGRFVEYSNNYYFYFEKYNHRNTNQKEKKELENALLYNYYQLLKDGKQYKALKRLYSYYKIKGLYKKLRQLEQLFNSDTGKLSKMKSSLETIDLVLNQTFRRPAKIDIIHNLNVVKRHIPQYENEVNNIIKLSLNEMSPKLNELIKQMNNEINSRAKEWLVEKKFKVVLLD